jgi:DNA-directed RNA polymerase specialized sigma24 family protein
VTEVPRGVPVCRSEDGVSPQPQGRRAGFCTPVAWWRPARGGLGTSTGGRALAATKRLPMEVLRTRAFYLCRNTNDADDLLGDMCLKLARLTPEVLRYLTGETDGPPAGIDSPLGFAMTTLKNVFNTEYRRRTVEIDPGGARRPREEAVSPLGTGEPGRSKSELEHRSDQARLRQGGPSGQAGAAGMSSPTFDDHVRSALDHAVDALRAAARAGAWAPGRPALVYGMVRGSATGDPRMSPVWCPKHLRQPHGCPHLRLVVEAVGGMLGRGGGPAGDDSGSGIGWVRRRVAGEVEANSGESLHGTQVTRHVAPCATWLLFLMAYDILHVQRFTEWIDPGRIAPRMGQAQFLIPGDGLVYMGVAFPVYFPAAAGAP